MTCNTIRYCLKLFMAAVFTLTNLGASFAKEPIKIAVAGPHTGANATFGMQQWRGADKAVRDINAKGGLLNGRMIELVKADDACEPKQAVAVANRIVSKDGVIAVAGHFCSSSTIPASEVYDEAGVLMITPASTNPMVTERGLPNIMRMCGRDDQQGSVAADFIAKTLKAKKIGVVHDNTTYGRGLADAMEAQLKTHGLSSSLYEGLTIGEKDFNALVTKIKSAGVDVVYFGGLHSEAGLLIRQMRDQGVGAEFISGDGIVSSEFVKSAGGPQFTKGVYVTFGPDPRNLAESSKIVEEFKTKEAYDPEGYTLYSYAVIEAIASAIEATKSTKGDDLAKWLKANTVSTVMGQKSWNALGDLKSAGYVMYQWDDKGSYKELM